MLVDDNREEHRMIIFSNDSRRVQEQLIAEDASERHRLLEQKVHEESYTVTLYVLLKYYGLTPVFRIKPRIRFHRSNYDNLSSSAPLQYSLDDIIHFAELKRGSDLTEKIDDVKLAAILGDAPALSDRTENAALQLVSQRDASLRNPPFKTKTKVFGNVEGAGGIPIGTFLDALNQPQRTEQIFKEFTRGSAFARDLRDALEPYETFEFQFGLYSRYERRDCILASDDVEMRGRYRATFDPWTSLGYIRTTGDTQQQFQILSHERGTRWEHKIMIEDLDAATLQRLATEIPALRREYLIGRVLSKSQTALTMLACLRESQLNLLPDLPIGYQLRLEVPLPSKRFSIIKHRRKLHQLFNGTNAYQLHPHNVEIVEKHRNLAKGIRDGIVWTLDNVDLLIGVPPKLENSDGFLIIKTPQQNRFVVRSAQELRERLPKNGFERCWNETIDEGGYTLINQPTGRCYTVSYGRKATGSIQENNITEQQINHYLSIEYLGIVPPRAPALHSTLPEESNRNFFDKLFKRQFVPSFFNQLMETEAQVISEMKTLARYCKEKLAIP